MIACPVCCSENPDKAKFCNECGASLAAPPAVLEERKVVTTLFCDLVAFTAMSEAADPEDVDTVLGEYFSRATKVIESHGGTVEKFIGDAVVGVFGVPAVHEDDPERAVRAGLRLLEALEGMTRPDGSPLEARCGVNTGEALVRLDVDPASGRGFLTGDAVNTAARLEAAAPPGGVVVGAVTHELTERVILYEELSPVSAKGKAEPVAAWLATGTIARRGIDASAGDLTPLVGREAELAYLSAVFGKAVSQSSAQFTLIVGEPGIGKSRLVRELSVLVDSRPDMITWRQGYCPPFGEDVTYWALAEIVRGHAGIRDGGSQHEVEAKLDAVLPEGPDHDWLAQRLRALLGLEAPEASREENFAAWVRFFEGMAATRPTVLVFEDLHWADDALLAFLEYLTVHLAHVPLMFVGTGRPELLERRRGLAAAGPMTRVDLGLLSPAETAHLIAGLLDASDDRADAVAKVVERCAGNPFYAEQSARLLVDTTLETSLPGSVQAVIAARLDTLPPDEKTLLADASVIGSVFLKGAVAAIGERDPQALERCLSGLLQRRLIRRLREPSMEGEHEFAFVHALARDVAYSLMPRLARARKHAAVAAWIEEKAGSRVEEFAEILAYHYSVALGLARAADDGDLAERLTGLAVRCETMAGERVFNADLSAAERHFRAALDLVGTGAWERGAIQGRLGEALLWSGRHAEAEDLLEDAVSGLCLARDPRRAAVALVCLARAREDVRGTATLEGLYRDALALLNADGPSAELVRVLTECGRFEITRGELELGLAAFERALETARQSGAPEPALALCLRAGTLGDLGMAGGEADMRRSLELAQQQGLGVELGRVWVNYCTYLSLQEGPRRALEEHARALAFAKSRGLASILGGVHAQRVELLLYAGRWEEAIAETALLGSSPHDDFTAYDLFVIREMRLVVLAWQGDLGEAQDQLESVLAASEAFAEAFSNVDVAVGLMIVAVVEAPSRPDHALLRLEQMLAMNTRGGQDFFAFLLPEAGRIAVRGHDLALAERLRSSWPGLLPVEELVGDSIASMLAEGRGEHEAAAAGFADAAARWHGFGVPYEEGQALLGRGRCLAALGRVQEAAQPLDQAREILERLGAKPALKETEEWMAKAR